MTTKAKETYFGIIMSLTFIQLDAISLGNLFASFSVFVSVPVFVRNLLRDLNCSGPRNPIESLPPLFPGRNGLPIMDCKGSRGAIRKYYCGRLPVKKKPEARID